MLLALFRNVPRLIPFRCWSLAWPYSVLAGRGQFNSENVCPTASLCLLRTLGTVFRTALLTVTDTRGIQRTAHGVITHTWQVLNTTTANQNDTVILHDMPFTPAGRRTLN